MHARAGPRRPRAKARPMVHHFPQAIPQLGRHKGLPKTPINMEPADEELQQLTAPPARTSNNKARALIGCVALASTGLLFAVTQQQTKRVSPAVLAAREIVKKQIADHGDTAPGAGPHGPGDADVTHEADSCSDPCIPCTNAGSYSSFPTIVQHLMVYNKEATPYGGVIFTDRGQYGVVHQEDPYDVRSMVSSVVDQYDDLLDTCLNSDPSVDGADTCSHYYVNSCDLDQSSRDSQVSCVEACVTDRFAKTMKGTIDDVSVCAYPVSSTFLLAPNVVKSCMDPTYDASEGGLYDVDSGCYECISGCMEAQGGVDAWVLECEER